MPQAVHALTGRISRFHLSPIDVLWFVYLVGRPYMVLPSGLPQPQDWIGGIAATASLWDSRRRSLSFSRSFSSVVRWLSAFLIWALCVDACWAYILNSEKLLITPCFYIFDALILVGILVRYRQLGSAFLLSILYALVASVALQSVLGVLHFQTNQRNAISFNNPNQLGYYALLVGSILAMSYRSLRLASLTLTVAFSFCMFLIALALSKAALVAAIVLLLLLKARNFLAAIAFLSMTYFFLQSAGQGYLVGLVKERLALIGHDSDDNLEARGYTRIANYPQYLALGAGEGADDRFGQRDEMHSTVGTLLFAYGIPGLLLFGGLLSAVYQSAKWPNAKFLIPGFLYGLTHQGLRFPEFWILIAFVWCLGHDCTSLSPVWRRSSRWIPDTVSPA